MQHVPTGELSIDSPNPKGTMIPSPLHDPGVAIASRPPAGGPQPAQMDGTGDESCEMLMHSSRWGEIKLLEKDVDAV